MLVDFGLAGGRQRTSTDDGQSPNPRTIDYAGLERATGVRKDDPRSDIYFLGCIFYHMLTGKPPIAETRTTFSGSASSRFDGRRADHASSIPHSRKPIVGRRESGHGDEARTNATSRRPRCWPI